MAYIGKTPVIGNFVKLDSITAVNGQAAYTMQNGGSNFTDYESVNQFLVSLNGTIQAPTDSFTVSGSTLTFASNLSTGDVIDFIMVFGNSLSAGTPTDATVTTAKLADSAVTAAKITDATITAAKLASGTVQNQSAFKNLLINGDMNISQRATSFTGLTNGGGSYTLDRYKFSESGTITSVYTYSQETDVPSGQGFAKSLKIQNTTAGSGHNVIETIQYIEAQNCQHLKFGTSNAESLTLSFWVKCTEAGTGNIALYNLDSTRMIAKNYTISSANTWEKITLTFPGDTSGTINNDNGAGLAVFIPIAAAGSYNTGTPGSWQTYSNGLRGAGMTIDLSNSTSDNIYITGMQLEVGTSASDFEFLPADVNLARCQRYFEKTLDKFLFTGSGNVADRAITLNYTVQKRATPTVTFSDITADGGGSLIAQTFSNAKHLCVEMSGGSGGRQFFANYKADAEL